MFVEMVQVIALVEKYARLLAEALALWKRGAFGELTAEQVQAEIERIKAREQSQTEQDWETVKS